MHTPPDATLALVRQCAAFTLRKTNDHDPGQRVDIVDDHSWLSYWGVLIGNVSKTAVSGSVLQANRWFKVNKLFICLLNSGIDNVPEVISGSQCKQSLCITLCVVIFGNTGANRQKFSELLSCTRDQHSVDPHSKCVKCVPEALFARRCVQLIPWRFRVWSPRGGSC